MIYNKKFKLLATLAMIFLSPVVVVGEVAAANSLLDFLGGNKRKKQMQMQQNNFIPQSTTAPAASRNKVEKPPKAIIKPIKRVTVATPRALIYTPSSLVKVDFSQNNFIQALAVQEAALIFSFPRVVMTEVGLLMPSIKSAELLQRNFSFLDIQAEKEIAEVLQKFYTQKGQLIWSKKFVVSEGAEDLMNYLSNADEDGLDPSEYAVAVPDSGLTGEELEKAFSQFDVVLSARALRYVHDAAEGRIIANRLSKFHDLPLKGIDLEAALVELYTSEKPSEVASSYLPSSKAYKDLKKTLATFNKDKKKEKITIKPGTIIRPGQENSELPKIIALITSRASATYIKAYKEILQKHAKDTIYNPELVNAFKDYQKSVKNKPDGIIGSATINALQGNSSRPIKKQRILYSMDRLRWLPHDLKQRYVFINEPSYRAQYIENGTVKLDMKIVVGSLVNQTTFFYDEISTVQFNPSWGVPRSIMLNEMMPRILSDPSYLNRRGYKVYDTRGRVVAPDKVNWERVAGTGYGVDIRQQPGTGNALGELKILFPNKHDIYLHDTPNKTAFKRDMRAISHGCVRLEDPRAMAAAVLGKEVKGLSPYFKHNENNISLNKKVPVYLTYFTAWPDIKTGEVKYFDDIYKRDSLMVIADEKTRNSRISMN